VTKQESVFIVRPCVTAGYITQKQGFMVLRIVILSHIINSRDTFYESTSSRKMTINVAEIDLVIKPQNFNAGVQNLQVSLL